MLNRHKCLLKVAEKWAIMDANATGADMNNNFFEMCNSVLRQDFIYIGVERRCGRLQ